VLWLGWFGFNPGSTMAADPTAISHIVMTTNTAAVAAILSSTVISWILIGKPDFGMTLNGCLAGLVAVTASCAYISIGSSLIIGFIAGILVVVSVIFFDRMKIDDPVGALSVHLVNGVFGTLAVGLFAQNNVGGISSPNGLFYGGGLSLLFSQLIGMLTTAFYVFFISLIFWYILKSTIGIRVSLHEEIQGLDIGEHGNTAYPEFLSRNPIYSAVGVNTGKDDPSTVIRPMEKENV